MAEQTKAAVAEGERPANQAMVLPGETQAPAAVVGPTKRQAAESLARIAALELMGLDLLTWAKLAYESGYFTSVRSISQVVMKVQMGRDMGLSPTQALRHLYVTDDGHLGIQGELMAAKIRESGRYDYEILHADKQYAEIEFFRLDGKGGRRSLGKSKFTIEEAKEAGLVRPDKPRSSWNTYREDMLLWRAMSRGQRRFCPDVFNGVTVYEKNEAFEIPRENGAGGGAEAVPPRPELPAAVQALLAAVPWTQGQKEMWEATARREKWDEARMVKELEAVLGRRPEPVPNAATETVAGAPEAEGPVPCPVCSERQGEVVRHAAPTCDVQPRLL